MESTGNYWKSELFQAEFILGELATLGGRFSLSQREVTVYHEEHPVPTRNVRYGSVGLFLSHYAKKNIISLHFGYIYPSLNDPKEERNQVKLDLMTNLGEMMFDIDMDDYDMRKHVCKCPKQAVCDKCWTAFMRPACQYLLRVFQELMGWTRFFFVFSGRRGMHVWVVEPDVLWWTHHERKTFMDALMKDAAKMWSHKPEHPFLSTTDVFPRFDVPVTTQPGHNHKIPLGLHGTTGNFCGVMFDPLTFLPSKDIIHCSKLTKEMVQRHVDEIRKHLH